MIHIFHPLDSAHRDLTILSSLSEHQLGKYREIKFPWERISEGLWLWKKRSFRHAELLKKGMKSSWIGWGSAENCRVELVPVSDWSWGEKQKWIQSLRSVSSHPGTPLSPEAWFMSIRSLETIINMMCVGMGEVDHHLQWGLHQVKTATHSLRYLIHFFADDHPAFFWLNCNLILFQPRMARRQLTPVNSPQKVLVSEG